MPELSSPDPWEPIIGWPLHVEVKNGLGGASGLLCMGFAPGSLPFEGGTFLLDPGALFLFLPIVLSNPGGGPGTGSFGLEILTPPDPVLVSYPLYMQALVMDPGAPKGVALSPGLQVSFGNEGGDPFPWPP